MSDNVDKLVRRINTGDCVLFLGPDLFTGKDNASIYSSFSKGKCELMKKSGIKYDEQQEDNIYYTVTRYIKGITEQEKKEEDVQTSTSTEKVAFASFLKQNTLGNEMYKQLAKLPFCLTINANPDNYLHQLQQMQPIENRKYHFGYYDFMVDNNEARAEKTLPSEIDLNNFVVYNVYGDAANVRSVILNESDFIAYSRQVNLTGNGMPTVIKNFIKTGKVCLFLGFKYDSWPLKILLQSLGFSITIPEQNISFSYNGLAQYHADFYADELKFVFFNADKEEFIDKLYKRFTESSGTAGTPKEPVNAVFISKAFPRDSFQEEDKKIRDKISARLTSLISKGHLTVWAEDLKKASESESTLIDTKFKAADIFILLGSDALFDDDVDMLMQKAIALVQQDPRKQIVPVYVRHFNYKNIEGIHPGSWIPVEGTEPVPILDNPGTVDRKCTEVSNHISQLVSDIISKKANG